MAKVKFNVNADSAIVERFREHVGHFGGRLGDCLSAAMLLWLEADPEMQGDLLRRLHDAEVGRGVRALVEEALDRQSDAVRKRRSK